MSPTRLLKVLRAVEWAENYECSTDLFCPLCGAAKEDDGGAHTPECELAALIEECGRAVLNEERQETET